jgi:hypothetical protein
MTSRASNSSTRNVRDCRLTGLQAVPRLSHAFLPNGFRSVSSVITGVFPSSIYESESDYLVRRLSLASKGLMRKTGTESRASFHFFPSLLAVVRLDMFKGV